jgi:hypothetical protein
MVVLNKKGFKLPYMEREEFIQLMRLGLDRSQSSFYIKNYNNIDRLIDTISHILKGEEVTFLQTCLACGKDFACTDCKYQASCTTRNLPFQCICPTCLKEGRTADQDKTDNEE